MVKRLICLLCVFVLCLSCAVAEEEKPVAERYDFDLTFSLNPDAVPARNRSRARGYAELLDRLEIRGNIIVCESTQSFDMNATLFFRDKPEVSIPFRFYGVPSLLFLTSPIIGNETVLFNMIGLAEFAIKVRKSLNTPLPALALLYPVVYQHNLWNIWEAWEQYTGPGGVTRTISSEQISQLADVWSELIETDNMINVWMTALISVSSASEAVEAEVYGIPSYLRDFVSAGKPLTVKAGDGTETWQNAAGMTLFTMDRTDDSQTWALTLPADENRYTPNLTFTAKETDNDFSFTLDASMIRAKAALPAELSEEDDYPVSGLDGEVPPYEEDDDYPVSGLDGEIPPYEEEYDETEYPLTGSDGDDREYNEGESGETEAFGYGDEEDSQWPETMVLLSASGSSIPVSLPSDASFSLAASVKGALYPNFNVAVSGKTEKDGSVSVLISLPQEGTEPETLLSVEGVIVRGEPVDTVPDFNYGPDQLYGAYNFFSFSEYYVAKFKNAVTKPLLKGLLDFVAEAPTSAVQSLLDDLTDSGIMNMMMDQ